MLSALSDVLLMLAHGISSDTLGLHAQTRLSSMNSNSASAKTGHTAESDRADVALVLAGAVDHFAILVDRHQGRIVSYLTRLVGRSDAEDLAQDTFVRAYQALDRFDPTYPFRGWLLVIASRLAANHAAKRRETTLGEHNDQTRTSQSQDPAQQVSEHDDAAHLQRRIASALASLSTESLALYELRFRQELSLGELAHHFAVSENAIKVRIHRLRLQLANKLGMELNHDHQAHAERRR
jgi:RNA polymerase sigma-70 factor, ECF subfamily